MNLSLNRQITLDTPVDSTMFTVAASNLSRTTIVVEASLYIYIWVTVVNAVIFLTGVVGNIMVIIVVIKVRDMRTTTNYFLVNLSIADLLVLLICQPSALLEFYAKDRWYIGQTLCKAIPLLENAVIHASILTILAITTERFNAICFPLKRTLKFTARVVVKVIAVIWIVSYVTAMPFVFMTSVEDTRFLRRYTMPSLSYKNRENVALWLPIVYAFRFLHCTSLRSSFHVCQNHSLSYIRLCINLITQKPQFIYNIRTRHQVVRMLIAIVVLFFLSMFPLRVVTLWIVYAHPQNVEALGMEGYFNLLAFVRAMVYLNSAGNPVIYSLASTKFKLAVRRVWGTYSPASGQRLYKNKQHVHGKDLSLKRFTTNQLGTNSNNSRRICIEISFHSIS
ncbi:LOW QUALITY PROTEIN: cholecystokinin receptor type A-like [Pecten maximus]|uniref:LOW QUALITY PROTEIN: cholecystokinin receptor type A-like n=1 Tax=Pecten maximus TaxID=6579 RepID=UPI00145878DB|nr:LOW QUALITY PROTEIN: cholecystokinin receptor type A-like [Pecten maximus]